MASKWEKLCSIMHKARRIFKAVAFVIIVVMYSASAKTITVDNNQSADFTRIQDAIDFAESGDTIFVYSGNFYETITIDKKIILLGIGKNGSKPLINANGKKFAIILNANMSQIEGFRVENANIGVYVTSNNSLIRNNTLLYNKYGIYLNSSHNNTIQNNSIQFSLKGIFLNRSTNNIVKYNNISENCYGVFLNLSHGNIVNGNSVNSNHLCGFYAEDGGKGIFIESSDDNTLNGNAVRDNKDTGIYFKSLNNNNTLNGNTVSNNVRGIYLSSSENNTLINNVVISNDIVGIFLCFSNINYINNNSIKDNYKGLFLWHSSYNKLMNNNISSNFCGLNLWHSNNSIIEKNNISDNYRGISIIYSSNNSLSNNLALYNDIYDIYDYSSNKNHLFNNQKTNKSYIGKNSADILAKSIKKVYLSSLIPVTIISILIILKIIFKK